MSNKNNGMKVAGISAGRNPFRCAYRWVGRVSRTSKILSSLAFGRHEQINRACCEGNCPAAVKLQSVFLDIQCCPSHCGILAVRTYSTSISTESVSSAASAGLASRISTSFRAYLPPEAMTDHDKLEVIL
jgi:hypothetical protein